MNLALDVMTKGSWRSESKRSDHQLHLIQNLDLILDPALVPFMIIFEMIMLVHIVIDDGQTSVLNGVHTMMLFSSVRSSLLALSGALYLKCATLPYVTKHIPRRPCFLWHPHQIGLYTSVWILATHSSSADVTLRYSIQPCRLN